VLIAQEQSKRFIFYLLLTAVVCGALVMVIEVMGSRVVGPFYGVSLFVWTSLISVTLISLSIGYAAGGYLSDRYSEPKYLYLIIIFAGIFTLLVPWQAGFVLKHSASLGLRLGAFVSTLVIFGPTLFLLGCVSPYLVRISTSHLRNLGAIVGGLYALSTIGSTVGTVLTGFVLVEKLGVDKIFLLTGLLLIVLSVGYFIFFKRQWLSLSAIILPVFMYHSVQYTSKTLSDGSELIKVAQKDSFYGTIKVVDSKTAIKHSRYLMIDSMIQGGMDMHNGLSIYTYNYYLQFLPYMLHPAGENCLVIGLGAGLVPSWYEQQGIRCDIVDIDEKISEISQKYFNFHNSGKIYTEDGRYFLTHSDQQYDYIILDVFNGEVTPAHLLSVEAMHLLKQRLKPQGVLGINLIGSLVKEKFMTASVIKTVEQEFDQVEIYPAFKFNERNGVGNVVVIAYLGKPRDFQPIDNRKLIIHPFYEKFIRANLATRFEFPTGTNAIVLTDNYNPIDFYDFWLREYVRKNILEAVDWDLLVG